MPAVSTLSRPNDRLQLQSFIHRVKNCLRPGLDAHPDFRAASCSERATLSSLRRSARDWILKGTALPSQSPPPQTVAPSALSAKTSSPNQMCCTPTLSSTRASLPPHPRRHADGIDFQRWALHTSCSDRDIHGWKHIGGEIAVSFCPCRRYGSRSTKSRDGAGSGPGRIRGASRRVLETGIS